MKEFNHIAGTFLTLSFATALFAVQNPVMQNEDSGKVTLTGCLEQDQQGNYILREPSGKPVVLAGLESRLYEHVNQKIRVTGKFTNESSPDDPQGQALFRFKWVQPAGGGCESPAHQAGGTTSPNPNR